MSNIERLRAHLSPERREKIAALSAVKARIVRRRTASRKPNAARRSPKRSAR